MNWHDATIFPAAIHPPTPPVLCSNLADAFTEIQKTHIKDTYISSVRIYLLLVFWKGSLPLDLAVALAQLVVEVLSCTHGLADAVVDTHHAVEDEEVGTRVVGGRGFRVDPLSRVPLDVVADVDVNVEDRRVSDVAVAAADCDVAVVVADSSQPAVAVEE